MGPIKSDWTKPCPANWTWEERAEKCFSPQEAVYGTQRLKRLEEIKTKLDSNNLFNCFTCISTPPNVFAPPPTSAPVLVSPPTSDTAAPVLMPPPTSGPPPPTSFFDGQKNPTTPAAPGEPATEESSSSVVPVAAARAVLVVGASWVFVFLCL